MRRAGGLALAFAPLLVLAVAVPARAQVRRVRALQSFDARVAGYAREGAIARLRSPECQGVLTDFRDPEGRTLLENLDRYGVPAHEYLAMIPFLDGSDRPLCQANRSQLLTTRAVPRVFVCKPFLATVQQERDRAEVYVIHEMLHTLGLDENPPSSNDITQQVIRRCAS
jgi:hypothetical protein